MKVNILLCIALAISTSACSTGPRNVHAKTELVPKTIQEEYGTPIPESYWELLNDPMRTELARPTYKIYMSTIYISALQNRCREIRVVFSATNNISKRVICSPLAANDSGQVKNPWFLLPGIQQVNDDMQDSYLFN